MKKTLKAEESVLLIRVNDFEKYSFVDEHKKILKEHKNIWMLKTGRHLADRALRCLNNTGWLILKEPKKSGDKYYICTVDAANTGSINNNYIFPSYYEEMADNGTPLQGTWICISSLIAIPEEIVDKIELSKSHKKVKDVVNATRSPILYVESKTDLLIDINNRSVYEEVN